MTRRSGGAADGPLGESGHATTACARAALVSDSGAYHLTVSAVARRMGVAPATLRTWDRRYGLGPTSHTAGQHRRYSAADVERLGVMQRLTRAGVTPAEAARAALAGAAHDETVTALVPEPPVTDAPHGGRVVPLGDAAPAARGLARAAMALDSRTCEELIGQSVAAIGVLATWETVTMPVLVGIGERWARTGEGIDVEHLLSECVMAVHRPLVHADEPVNPRPVLLAGVENDLHGLVLHVLAAALAEQHVQSRLLGSQVPHRALAAAALRLGPVAVFLWSSMHSGAVAEQLDELPVQRPRAQLFVGGPGWDRVPVPAGAVRLSTLHDAVGALLTCAAG